MSSPSFPTTEYMSTRQILNIFGFSKQRVYELGRLGEIGGFFDGSDWRWETASVKAWYKRCLKESENKVPGRKAKKKLRAV